MAVLRSSSPASAPQLQQLHRVLKETGSICLHCDSTASHYLKLLMDAIFEPERFRNEIIWKRTTTHSDSKTWSRVADLILFYTEVRFVQMEYPT
jgi:site-specific DNA-methyltransferase (adenine-specific)